MRTLRANRKSLTAALALCALALLAAACSTDSPSEPQQSPGTPPGTTPPASTYNITVTPSDTELTVGDDQPVTLTVRIRRANNNQPPPAGTTATLATSLGNLLSANSGTQSVVLSLVNGEAQVLLFAGGIAGQAVVQAQLEGSIGRATITIRELGDFFISAVNPNTGNPNGGDVITVTGGGFQEPVRVSFDGNPGQVQSVSSSSIRVLTPASDIPVPTGSTNAVDVEVTINVNQTDQQDDTLANAFTYVPGGGGINTPQVLSVSPASGPNEGGTRVTITGQSFDAPVQVLFGSGTLPSNFTGVEATVQSVTSTQIIVTTPSATGFGQANQNTLVDILVRNLDSGFGSVFANAFRYGSDLIITSVVPNEIDFDSRDTVTIFGQGFDEPVNVDITGIQAQIISVTGTQIVVRPGVPFVQDCTQVSGPVQVVNIETGESDTTSSGPGPLLEDFIYRVLPPTLTGVSPNSGPGTGGTVVTLSGVGFSDPVRVLFGDVGATVTSTTPSAVTVLSPPFSMFDEEACDDDGDGNQGMRFVPTAVDLQIINLITDCDDMLMGGYTYRPTDTSCRGDAAPAPAP